MTRKELIYVVTICNEKSFSAAAKKLFVSQPALSQSIRRLEDEYGFTLFTRIGGKAEPTAACRLVAEKGKPILEAFDRFEDELKVYAESRRSELTVAMPPYHIKNLLPFILPDYQKRCPEVHAEIVEERSDMAEQLAMQDLISFCVVVEPLFVKNIGRLPLFQSEFVLAVPNGHPFCEKHPYRDLSRLEDIDLRELKDQPFALVRNPRSNAIQSRIFEQAGFEPVIYRRSSVWDNIKDYVRQGQCAALLQEFIVTCRPEEEHISYYRLPYPDRFQQVVAAFHPGKRFSEAEQAFLDILREYRTIAKRQS